MHGDCDGQSRWGVWPSWMRLGASEAMRQHLGISTTHTLSLIVSHSENTSTWPWCSEGVKTRNLPGMEDPRLARYYGKKKRDHEQIFGKLITSAAAPINHTYADCNLEIILIISSILFIHQLYLNIIPLLLYKHI